MSSDSPVAARVRADGRKKTRIQTDRHDEANCRFSQFLRMRLKTMQILIAHKAIYIYIYIYINYLINQA
jgi:hypothetical protein